MEYKKKINDLALRAFEQSTSDVNFKTLHTTKEKIHLGKRVLIAQAILEGKTRYEINNHISISPNTFSQIRKWLDSELGVYESAYNPKSMRVNKRRYPEPLTYEWLKKKYPAHFLLFSLVDELFKVKK